MFSSGFGRRSWKLVWTLACSLLLPCAQAQEQPATPPAAAPQDAAPQSQPQAGEQQRSAGSTRQIPGRRGYTQSGLIGMVESAAGVPVGGATIVITPQKGMGARSETTAEGIFRVGSLNAGTYKLEITAPGFAPLT